MSTTLRECTWCGSRSHISRACPRVQRATPQDMDRAENERRDKDERRYADAAKGQR